MTASGSVLLFSWPIYLLGLLHDNLSSYLVRPLLLSSPSLLLSSSLVDYPFLFIYFQTLASQMENYMDAQSGGRGAEAYTQQMVDTIVALNITPFGSAVLMQILTGDIPRLMQCIYFHLHLSIFICFYLFLSIFIFFNSFLFFFCLNMKLIMVDVRRDATARRFHCVPAASAHQLC